MMATALLGPNGGGSAVELSKTLFRKQVLPIGKISYKGRTIRFDEQYLTDLASAFTQGAFDQVPFLLAKDDNAHTMDPERYRGEVKGVEVTSKGLDVLLDLTPAAADLVRQNPKLGVSARIIEGLERADGQKYPRVLQHVLGTLDPRVTGMGSWQEVSLSEAVEDTVDITHEEVQPLSDITGGAPPAEGGASPVASAPPQAPAEPTAPPVTDTGQPPAAPVTPPPVTPPAAPLTAPLGTSRNPQPVMTFDEEDYDDISDEDISAAVASLPGRGMSAPAHIPVGATLSNDDNVNAIELLRQHDQANEDRIRNLELQLAAERFKSESADMIAAGVPPVLVELARPVLSLPATPVIELSNSEHVDVGRLLREMLAQTKGLIELSTERGSVQGGKSSTDAEADRVLSAWSTKGGKV